MSSVEQIPKSAVVDQNGKMALDWRIFMQSLLVGDPGNKFKPDVEGLSSVGTPSFSGVYYQNQGFIDFYVTISPGTSTTSTGGSTYIQLPFTVTSDVPCFATTSGASSLGGITASNNRAYLPSWSGLTTPVTVSGRFKTQ
jgi:hypothetical protein